MCMKMVDSGDRSVQSLYNILVWQMPVFLIYPAWKIPSWEAFLYRADVFIDMVFQRYMYLYTYSIWQSNKNN